jgi:YidC/Oxa1 family membrane protein insertase
MARPLLWFILIFGALVLFGPCRSKKEAPPAVGTVRGSSDEDGHLLEGPGGRQAKFTGDGALLRLSIGERPVARPDVPLQRIFSTLYRTKGGARPLFDPKLWKFSAADAAVEFTWSDGTAELRKRFSFGPDGALLAQIDAKGLPEGVTGIELTTAIGVDLGEPDGPPAGLFLARPSGSEMRAWEALAQRQEQAPEEAWTLAEGATHRVGLVGPRSFVRLDGLPGGAELRAQAMLVKREDLPVRRDIEAWATLPAKAGSLSLSLSLAFGDREALPALEPALFARPEFTAAQAAEHRLENGTMRVDVTDLGAAILGMWLKRYASEAGLPLEEKNWVELLHPAVGAGRRPLTLSVQDPDRFGVDPARTVWKVVSKSATRIEFSAEGSAGWKFTKKIALPEEDRYDLSVEITVTPPAGVEEKTMNFSLIGPSAVFIEDVHRGISQSGAAEGIILERKGGNTESRNVEAVRKEALKRDYPQAHERGLLRGIGVRGSYFVCILATPEEKDAQGFPAGVVSQATVRALTLDREVVRPDGVPSKESLLGSLACSLDLKAGAVTRAFTLYAGPNDLSRLRPLQLGESIDYGFFGFIGRALMWLMKFFEGIVGSFGLAVILMTLAVRMLLFPVSYRTQLSMSRYSKRLQKIKPLLEEIEKKYAGNRERIGKERLLLMREHKVGLPLGCLVIFIQIPIWYGLFQALRVEFALRHQPFLWATDLAMPDRLFGLPFWPHWFNLLPLLMLVLWVVQQKVTPQAGSEDPQVQAQMKMVKLMPYVFFFFLYNYAAALSVYMCVSSLWSILEGRLVRNAIQRAG